MTSFPLTGTRSGTRSGLSRRGFLAAGSALGLLLPLGMARAESAAPVKGGVFNLGMAGGSTDNSLDPRAFTQQVQRVIGVAVCNQLVEVLPDGTLAPELAESWDSTDAITWVLKIRSGVTFHNGKTLDAADVVYSVNLHRGEDTTSGAKSLFNTISDIQVTAADEVTVVLDSANAEFMRVFADYHAMIVPDGFTDWPNLTGSGGYRLVSFDPGVRAVLERNPDYWKSDRAHVDQVVIHVINDGTSRLAALQSGMIDVINQVDRKVVPFIRDNPKLDLVRSPGAVHWTFICAADKEPTSNNHIRQALMYGCDRQAMLDLVMGGLGSLGNDHPISPDSPYYNADLPQRLFDPERAQFHLKAAGMEDFSIDLYTSEAALPEAIDLSMVYAAKAGPAGLKINVQRRPADGYWTDAWMKQPFAVSSWLNRPIDQTFSLIYGTGSSWNESYWSNERFDALLAEGKAALDFDRRKEIYGEMQAILHNEGPSAIPVFADFLDAKSVRVKGFEPSNVADLSGDRIIERIWLEG
ncbi:ABC transporter substrate-binding protein [Paracoccus sp. IB05]|uniref:ABC transporter substrate-binding protein n=1 Tax=Paracoccus sp. IB05 TaxID=2779367 RepID=UPI0018E8F550|nr:ABC transporter substrate-binding protein [Paracoccus sp. IB05]MBJ2153233.1 ABC transporter substrate-binding protein [Paracoccus sp. IB05]